MRGRISRLLATAVRHGDKVPAVSLDQHAAFLREPLTVEGLRHYLVAASLLLVLRMGHRSGGLRERGLCMRLLGWGERIWYRQRGASGTWLGRVPKHS